MREKCAYMSVTTTTAAVLQEGASDKLFKAVKNVKVYMA